MDTQPNAPHNPSSNASALQACLREAVAESPALIKRWISGLNDELRIQASAADSFAKKTLFINSQNQLLKCRAELEHQWQAIWAQTIQEGLKGASTSTVTTRRSFAQISFEDLELMGDDQIQATVEVARTQQSVQLIADQALTDLSARISRAQGSSVIKASQNPLRPEIVVQTLTQVIDTVCPDKKISSLWLKHGSKGLGQELADFYRHLGQLLQHMGVKPALYGSASQTMPTAGMRGGDGWGNTGHGALPNYESLPTARAAAPVAATFGSADFRPSSLLTLNHLHQLLVSELGQKLLHSPSATTPTPDHDIGKASPSFDVSAAPQPALPISSAAHDPQPIEDTSSPPLPPLTSVHSEHAPYQGQERRKRPRGVAQTEGDALERRSLIDLAEEVVGLMLDGIAQDERLLPPVIQTLQRLRPALLQVARKEPRFFADRGNPARRLVDEIAQRSLAFPQVNSPGFDGFVQRLQEAVGGLSQHTLRKQDIALHFERALYQLEQSPDTVPQTLEDTEAEQDKAVASLLKAEQRYLVAEKIAQKMQKRPDFSDIPLEIQQFVAGPWAQVIALAQMNPPATDKQSGGKPASQRYADLVSDLLWSCHPELASRNRTRLARVIPGLLKQLREGLNSIDYPPEQSAPFFKALMRYHETALRTSNSVAHDAPAGWTHSPNLDNNALKTMPDPGPWLSPSEIKDARLLQVAPNHDDDGDGGPVTDFADTEPMLQNANTPSHAAPNAANGVTGLEAAEMLPHDATWDLRVGAWIEIEQVAGQRQRAKLKWASPHGNMYLFIGTDGKSISMTKRMYQGLVEQQRIRLVADQSVVDDALDGVMAAAVRNSTTPNNR